MFNYNPLFKTLRDRNIYISDMRGELLNSRTIAAINKGESVSLATIAKICRHLQVPVEKVVEIEL